MSDLISRHGAIDHLRSIIDATDTKDRYNEGFADGLEFCISHMATMPSAQPYTIHSDGRLWITVDDIDKVNAVAVDESKSKFCKQFYMDAQPTLRGYNIEHIELIARVLQKEDLPPERVVEALTDIGGIVAIVRDEFEETLRKAVEKCTKNMWSQKSDTNK